MPRPRMQAGELGAVRVSVRPNGQTQADARMRDEAGALRRLKVVRATEQEARAALGAEADAIRYGTLGAPKLSVDRRGGVPGVS